MNRSFRSILAVAGLFVCIGSAQAALTAEVRDEATPKFFKAETVKEANEIIREIKHEHGEDLLIETFTEPPADRKEAIEKDRNKGFEEWARERAKTVEVKGVYILITHKPAHLQVEVGDKTKEKVFTLENRDHLSKLMLERFKEKEYDRGLIEGVKYVRDTMNANEPKKKPAPSAAGSHETAPPPSRGEENGGFTMPSFLGMGLFGWLCVGLVVLAVVWVVIAVIRAMSGAGRYGGGPGGYGGYGSPGYGGGGGGGFLSGMLGGLFGGMAGGWLYDRFFGGGSMGHTGSPSTGYDDSGNSPAAAPQDTEYSGTGGDFDQGSGDGGGGGDTGGGGDFGGGDDAGGGDFGGGGDSGGGDFGGGDSGGGGGDSGGGGGDF
jgi:hypothetical protein